MNEIRPALILTALFVLLTGALFPAVMWGAAQLLFPDQANGSLIRDRSGKVVGSRLIGQPFAQVKYFHPRPSAAGSGYDGASSSGTNLGPVSAKLINGIDDDPTTAGVDESFPGVNELAATYRSVNGLAATVVLPADAVTRSGSGLDPEISPANALLQLPRVAKARGVAESEVRALVEKQTKGRFLMIFGEPRVNVLELNLALDERAYVGVSPDQ